ncbi:MAG: hypothetical protein ACTS5Y_05635 [Pollutimonas bauzanensis]|uniref:Uncharacterized protein n=1 Tax=Pollutimonas bauzanensis TaxID=658167 RepID=A0A1M5WAD6_9BURK|nr:hypothetical protein [Pollutimonas bauzanensis]SHH84446.1 hypothetical protein SAMN04488135_105160 [Pollutimonas bauzanensis]
MPEADIKPAQLKGALRLIALLFGVLAIVIAVAAGLVHRWRLQAVDDQPAPAAALGPPPGLEAAPQISLAAYLAEKDRLIHGYAWIDKEKGLARIPLQAAMQAMTAKTGPAGRQEPP